MKARQIGSATLFRVGAACFAVIVGVVACQQVLGIDGTVSVQVPGDSVACGLPMKRGTCQACLEQRCCGQAQACAKDPSCAAYERCLTGCDTDYACRARCNVDHPIGASIDVPALDTCAVTSCESACGIGCGAVSSLAPPDAAAGCQDCLTAHACSAAETCGQSFDCQAIARCVSSCSTYDCQTACVAGRDAAASDFIATVYTAASACYGACGVGDYWECVGRVSYPFAKAPNIVLTLTFVDSEQHSPLPGLTVKACQNGDTACTMPNPMGTTDAQGSVALTFPPVPPNAYGFRGYLDISGPGIFPYLYFFSFPLSEPQAGLRLPLLSPAALDNLVSLVGVSLDMTRGHIAASSSDCFLNPAPGVVFTAHGIDATTREVYLEGNFLSNTATTTDRSGLVFFLNAPPTVVSLIATPRDLGRVSGHASVFVRPGTITLTQVNPSP